MTPVPPMAKPEDPMGRKLANLAGMRRKRLDLSQQYTLSLDERVSIHSQWQETPHRGTVTRVEPHRFMVTWDNHTRRSGQARERMWYAWSQAHNFTRDKTEAKTDA